MQFVIATTRLLHRAALRSLLVASVSVGLAFGWGSTAHAAEYVIAYDNDCVSWNIDQGCTEYLACAVYDSGRVDCNSYVLNK